jgi:hypothetical protein
LSSIAAVEECSSGFQAMKAPYAHQSSRKAAAQAGTAQLKARTDCGLLPQNVQMLEVVSRAMLWNNSCTSHSSQFFRLNDVNCVRAVRCTQICWAVHVDAVTAEPQLDSALWALRASRKPCLESLSCIQPSERTKNGQASETELAHANPPRSERSSDCSVVRLLR